MGVEIKTTGFTSRNRIGACTRGLASRAASTVRVVRGRILFVVFSWLVRLVGTPSARVAEDEGIGRTDDGRVVCDFKLEPTVCEV